MDCSREQRELEQKQASPLCCVLLLLPPPPPPLCGDVCPWDMKLPSPQKLPGLAEGSAPTRELPSEGSSHSLQTEIVTLAPALSKPLGNSFSGVRHRNGGISSPEDRKEAPKLC